MSTSDKLSSETKATPRCLVLGSGGGLDVVNASLLYFALESKGYSCALGAIRSMPVSSVEKPGSTFGVSGCVVTGASRLLGKGRFAEHLISNILDTPLYYLSTAKSRSDGSSKEEEEEKSSRVVDIPGLTSTMKELVETRGFTDVFFVDGGGDSLIFRTSDACSTTEPQDDIVFSGGDAFVHEATHVLGSSLPHVRLYQAIVAPGLDIGTDAFHSNISLLSARDPPAYFGRINFRSGEQDQLDLPGIDLTNATESACQNHKALCRAVLYLGEESTSGDKLQSKPKVKSHTASVVYHALHTDFGASTTVQKCRTYVRWEPRDESGPGVMVDQCSHPWMYFTDISVFHSIKLELNK